jgi:hypothetical protein
VTGASAMGLTTDPFASATIGGPRFEVYGLQPDEKRLVEIRHEGLGLASSATVSASDPADRPLVVQLAACGSITGRLLDEDGLPLGGAKVGAGFGRSYGPSDPIFRFRETVTDREGRFRIPGINPTLSANVGVQDPNHPIQRFNAKPEKDLRRLTIKSGETLDIGEVRVRFERVQ